MGVATLIPPRGPSRLAERDASGDRRPPGSALLYEETIDPNTATVEDLATLPGIGPARARRILERRGGGFCSAEQFRRAAGIGVRAFAKVERRIQLTECVSSSSSSG